MSRFEPLPDISFNTEKVADPSAFARERGAASWLCLTGEEFAAMEGGISYAQVQRAVGRSINVVSDSAEDAQPRPRAGARRRPGRASPPDAGHLPLRPARLRRRVHVRGPAGGSRPGGGAGRGRAERRAVLQVRRLQGLGAPVDRGAAARAALSRLSAALRSAEISRLCRPRRRPHLNCPPHLSCPPHLPRRCRRSSRPRR